jgi:hypothetical protein
MSRVMRAWLRARGNGVFIALVLVGCSNSQPNLVTPMPNEVEIPPDDPRWSNPVQYPDHVLNQGMPKKAGGPQNPLANGGGSMRGPTGGPAGPGGPAMGAPTGGPGGPGSF